MATRLAAAEAAPPWPGEQGQWNGFDQYTFDIDGVAAYVVTPAEPLPGNPWVWRARFPDYHAEMDIELIKQGYHVGYVDVAGLFGSPQAIERGEKFYDFVTERGLSRRPAMEGVSRGGLFVYNWAAKHPRRVACIYCDTPVLDFKSWPGGLGESKESGGAWRQCLQAYGLTAETVREFIGNPIDHAEVIAAAKIPILHIVSDNDAVVPPKENTDLLHKRLQAADHDMQIMRVAEGTTESSGHHFTHPDPQRVVDFIKQHTAGMKE
ncbi:MAG: prolyl oligopeptidase family serine peptidase [Pirellulales bacterium]